MSTSTPLMTPEPATRAAALRLGRAINDRALRLPATLLLAGQLLYIVVTAFHAVL